MFEGSTYLFCPVVERHGDSDFKISPELNRSRLRRSLLYFQDVLFVPYSIKSLFSHNLVDPETHLLLEQGILKTLNDRSVFIEKLNKDFFTEDAKNLFVALNQGIPDKSFVSSIPISNPANSNAANAIFCQIEDALPVPKADASIADIISFRMEHREQLARFGNHLERLALIIQSNLGDAEKVTLDLRDNLDRLTGSLRASKLFGGKADLSFSRFIEKGANSLISSAIGSIFGLDDFLSAILGATVQFSFRKGPVIEAGNSFPRSFEYLIDADKMRIFRGENKSKKIDDWIENRTNDRRNTVRLGMPESRRPIELMTIDGLVCDNQFG